MISSLDEKEFIVLEELVGVLLRDTGYRHGEDLIAAGDGYVQPDMHNVGSIGIWAGLIDKGAIEIVGDNTFKLTPEGIRTTFY